MITPQSLQIKYSDPAPDLGVSQSDTQPDIRQKCRIGICSDGVEKSQSKYSDPAYSDNGNSSARLTASHVEIQIKHLDPAPDQR